MNARDVAFVASCRPLGLPRRRASRAGAGLGVVAVLSLFAVGCRQRARTPEEQVRDTVGAIELAVEEKDGKALRKFIADEYRDAEEHDRQEVLAFLQVLFRRHGTIHLLTRIAAIDAGDDRRARASVLTAMASHPMVLLEDIARLRADVYQIDLELIQRAANQWQVTGATWREARPQDLFASTPP